MSSVSKPSEVIMKKLNYYKVTSIVKMASSYKFCVIAMSMTSMLQERERMKSYVSAVASNAEQ